MSPRDRTARCNRCQAPVVFFRSPFTSKPRTFDPRPVEPSHALAGVRAFPVLGGTQAYQVDKLVELLQVQRSCTLHEAEVEVWDMDWFMLHSCDQATGDRPAESAG